MEGEPAPSDDKLALLQSKIDSFENLLGEIKNERGEQKYLDVETAIKALKDSQEYIGKLKGETVEENKKLLEEIERYQRELSERESVASLMEKLKQQDDPPKGDENNMENENTNTQVDNASVASLEDIDKIVAQRLQEMKQKEQAESNFSKSLESISSMVGEGSPEEFLEGKAKELGLPKEALLNIAASSPGAFQKLVGVTKDVKASVPVGSGGRVQPFDDNLPSATPESNMLYGATDAQRQAYILQLTERAKKKLGVS